MKADNLTYTPLGNAKINGGVIFDEKGNQFHFKVEDKMTIREEIKLTLLDEAIEKERTYDLGDSIEMDKLFKEHEDMFYEKYGEGYDTRFCEIVEWCAKRYESEINNRIGELL